jgi:hypothetical protein
MAEVDRAIRTLRGRWRVSSLLVFFAVATV